MDSGAAPLASGGSRSVALALMPVMAAVLVVFVITGAALPAMSRYRRLNTRGFVALLSASDGHGIPFRHGLQAVATYAESRAL
jgi:hypothetical protein